MIQLINCVNMVTLITVERIKRLGHILKMSDEKAVWKMMGCKPDWRRTKGRPRTGKESLPAGLKGEKL